MFAGLGPDLTVNLARESEYLAFAGNPSELEQRLAATKAKTVFIDEVQRLPSLLNTVQAILDDSKRVGRPIRFLLTGSSARKLRRGQANLLPGRVRVFHLGPLVAAELDYAMDTNRALSLGTLPDPYLEPSAQEARGVLRSYAATYLREEIQAEALTRNLEGFTRFLHAAAAGSGQLLDFSKLAQRTNVSRTGIVRFFEMLEDTLIAQRLPPFDAPDGADLVKHPRYFFFDCGVLNGLLGDFGTPADRRGFLFEHLLVSQLRASAAARDKDIAIETFRTRGGLEIDFIVRVDGVTWAIEAKSGGFDLDRSVATFAKAQRYLPSRTRFAVATIAGIPRRKDHVTALPWQKLLAQMGL